MKLLQEADGKTSITRVSIAAVLVSYILWGSYIVISTSTIPDLPISLAGLLVGLYGFNKTKINLGGSK